MNNAKTIVAESIIETFKSLKNDYIEDKFKYFSETDAVFAFAWIFKRQKQINELINNGIIDIHFEFRPTGYSTQADLVIRMMNENGKWVSSSIIEFKIRVDGNKDRMLLDIRKTKELSSDGLTSFLFIFDRCASERQILDIINQELGINDPVRNNILWVSREHQKNEPGRRELTFPDKDELAEIKKVSEDILKSFHGWQGNTLSEADIVFEIYSRFLEHDIFMKFYNLGKVDIHLELRPFQKNAEQDLVIKDDSAQYAWMPQRLKNEGIRVDFTITRRDEFLINQALKKATKDQGNKMKYWRILSNPLESNIIFVEVKNDRNIKKDKAKLEILKKHLPESETFQIYKESGIFRCLKHLIDK